MTALTRSPSLALFLTLLQRALPRRPGRVVLAGSALVLAACAGGPGRMGGGTPAFSQAVLPSAVQVPAGHRVAWETVGTGETTYECRAKGAMPGSFEWVFVGPQATLADRQGMAVGRYYGPPATWEATDGSKVTATQLAVAPNGEGNLPMQLVQANPATGSGALTGVTYIQRVQTRGGVAPGMACSATNQGQRSTVKYQADYIFWKAA